MLVKALLNRLGTGSSTAIFAVGNHLRSGKATYNKYPRLATLVDNMLHESCFWRKDESFADQASRQIHNAFPAMEIVNRIGVQQARHDTVQRLLFQQLSSPVWILREKAARTLSSLIDDRRMGAEFRQSLQSQESQNELHGKLMCLKFSLENLPATDLGRLRDRTASSGAGLTELQDYVLDVSIDLLSYFDQFVRFNICSYLLATYFECITLLLHVIIRQRGM